ncbi:M48 family metallopeptidase [Acetonema longum]|uniref:Peptidase M48 n=1 Tax=Acetonema longum DSM 6540 TaxID=1009370 RepID=F7NJC8_9FIRM|nr:M48 family metallopeptidase [Acetonema longum]EGO63876.1 peptidase M48 [Acetonema longum DSM 6540]
MNKPLPHPQEKAFFIVCLIFSIMTYLALILSIVGIIYILFLALMVWIATGVFLGEVRTNSVKVSESQFPEVYHLATDLAAKMNLAVPDIYVMQAGGTLNAMATRFLGRNFVIIFSDVLELAYEEGEDALAFIVAHELAHIKQKHLSRRWLVYPGLLIPFLGPAYSRSCEYTCDSFGAYYVPDGAVNGLLILAAGKKIYNKVNVNAFLRQADTERGLFVWLATIISTHPPLTKRLKAITDVSAHYARTATPTAYGHTNA